MVRSERRQEDRYHYRRLAEAIPALIWLTDANGQTIFANTRWLDFTGVDIVEMKAGEIRDRLFHPDDGPEVMRLWQESRDSSSALEVEYRLRRHDGVYRWVAARVVPLYDSNGEIEQWLGAAIDIDDAKRSADYLRKVMEAVPQIFFTCDAEGRTDFYNQRWYDFTGIRPEDPVETAWQSVIHPDDFDRISQTWSQSVASGAHYAQEYRLLRAGDRTYRWHMVTTDPIHDADSNVVKWVGVATDIDDQKRREHALKFLADASELLAASFDVKERLQAVARLAVPEMADWCGIYVLRNDDELDPVAIVHRDPDQIRFAEELVRRYPTVVNERVLESIRSGKVQYYAQIPDEALRAAAHDERHYDLMAQLQLRSSIQVPLQAHGQPFGYLTFVNGVSGRIYTEQDVQLTEILAKRISVAIDNARVYERERLVASTFQHAALPRELPNVRGVSLSAVYRPAESEAEIGGDWYDAFPVGERKLAVSIGDVSGKGLDAAVLMGGVRQAFRVAALQRLDPAEIVAAADASLQLEYPGRIVSAFFVLIDLETLGCSYVSAGHCPAYVREAGGAIRELKNINAPLGALDRRDDVTGYAVLGKESMLLLYTDGLIEATRDVLVGEERLLATIASEAITHTVNPARFVYDSVIDREARDDVAILALTFGRSRHWTFDALDAARAQGARAALVRHLREEGSADSDYSAAEVIFGELVSNVVRYAPGPIDIDLEWNDDSPTLHVLDRGQHFSLDTTLPHDFLSENGRGLFIVQTLGSGLTVAHLPRRGNHVSVTLPVRRKTT